MIKRAVGISLLCLVFLCKACPVPAQEIYRPYKFPAEIPKDYQINADSLYQVISKTRIKDVSEEDMALFAEETVYQKSTLFTSGAVYFGWTELESYLNNILQKILPDSLADKKELHVYPTRNTEKNAFTFDDGSIFFNIGLLAELKDEAAIAIVLAHEVSHYIYKDCFETFLSNKNLWNTKSNRNNLLMLLGSTHSNRQVENRADKTAFQLCAQAGYSLPSGLNVFEQFQHDNLWIQSKFSWKSLKWQIYVDDDMARSGIDVDSLDIIFSTHPEPQNRANALKQIISLADNSMPGSSFIISQPLFIKLISEARKETVHLNFSSGDYESSIEKAFNYYLRDNQSSWLYYLTESIRRLIYIDPALRRQGFLTDDSKQKKFEGRKGILHDINYLLGDTAELREIVNRNKLIEPFPFESYEEAFHYFTRLALSQSVPETNLIYALYYYWKSETDSFTYYIDRYISDTTSQNKEYAVNLKNGLLVKSLNPTQEALFFNGFYAYKKLKYRYRYSYRLSVELIKRQDEKLKQFENDSSDPYLLVYPGRLKLKDFPGYIYQSSLENVIFRLRSYREIDDNLNPEGPGEDFWKQRARNEPEDTDVLKHNKELFIYAPEAWNYFKEKGISSLRTFYIYTIGPGTSSFRAVYEYIDVVENKAFYGTTESRTFGSDFPKSMLNEMKNKETKAFSKKRK